MHLYQKQFYWSNAKYNIINILLPLQLAFIEKKDLLQALQLLEYKSAPNSQF